MSSGGTFYDLMSWYPRVKDAFGNTSGTSVSFFASTPGTGTGHQLLRLLGPDWPIHLENRHPPHFQFWWLNQECISSVQDREKNFKLLWSSLEVADYSSFSVHPSPHSTVTWRHWLGKSFQDCGADVLSALAAGLITLSSFLPLWKIPDKLSL